MQPDISHWRSADRYDYMDALSVEGLAWECLRRNTGYQKDFARYLRSTGDKAQIDDAIASRWGLRFRRETEPAEHHPAGVVDRAGRSRRSSPDETA